MCVIVCIFSIGCYSVIRLSKFVNIDISSLKGIKDSEASTCISSASLASSLAIFMPKIKKVILWRVQRLHCLCVMCVRPFEFISAMTLLLIIRFRVELHLILAFIGEVSRAQFEVHASKVNVTPECGSWKFRGICHLQCQFLLY